MERDTPPAEEPLKEDGSTFVTSGGPPSFEEFFSEVEVIPDNADPILRANMRGGFKPKATEGHINRSENEKRKS